MVGFINQTLAHGLARQQLSDARETLAHELQRVFESARRGRQRNGAKLRRLRESIYHHLGNRLLVELRSGQSECHRARLITFSFFAVPERENGWDNVGCLSLIVPEKNPDQLVFETVPIILLQHVAERLHLRLQAGHWNAYLPELRQALAPLVSLWIMYGGWPEVRATDGQYMIPSPNGVLYARLDEGELEVVTFLDMRKLNEVQLQDRIRINAELRALHSEGTMRRHHGTLE